MLNFRKTRSEPGWLAIAKGVGRVDLVHVRREVDRLPQVLLAESIASGGDEGNIVATLATLKKSLHLGRYRLTALLAAGQYQFIQTDAIAGPPDEAREIARWKLKDQAGFAVDGAAIDLLPIPPLGRAPQVYAVLAAESVMAPLVQSFQAAKLTLAAVDVVELSQRNLAALFEEEDRALATLVFDEVEGLLTFTFAGELLVARHIEISAAQLAAADTLRREQLFERIALDVQRSLDNFDRSFSMVQLVRLVVAGIPGVAGFVEYLHDNLAIDVVPLNLAAVVDLGAAPALLDPQRQFQCLRALGAALREEPVA
ncbi:MAG: agglutinin biogenesis protein MshI [Rhodocyclales bacterium]|nr:agglutinin biogenesis protein MshI [Rhodocyclales bacterium]